MAIVFKSRKFDTDMRQSIFTAGNHVLLRVLRNEDDTYTVMTATADENDRAFVRYPQQQQLMDAAANVFTRFSRTVTRKLDRNGLPYFEFTDIDDPGDVRKSADFVAASLGLAPETCSWVDEEARNEMKALWQDLSVDDDSPAYLSDGMYVTSDGRLYDEKG